MLIQKEEFQNQSNENNQDNEINREEINNNLDELNSNTNQNQNPRRNARGFDIFLSHGLSAEEVRALRAIFHFTQAQQSLVSGIPLDWTNNGIYQREERWLINQLNNMVNRNLNLNEEENNDFITLNVNDNSLFMGRNSFSIFFVWFYRFFITYNPHIRCTNNKHVIFICRSFYIIVLIFSHNKIILLFTISYFK